MFDTSIETTVVITAVALWFAHGWYLNSRLEHVHRKLDATLEQLNGLREYLYEIDPQFDDERSAQNKFENHMANPNSDDLLSGMDASRLKREKQKQGRRTLSTKFSPEG